MVADWHGMAWQRRWQARWLRTTTMFLPAALLHDDDAMACSAGGGSARTAPLLYHFKISSGETRERPTVVLDGAGPARLLLQAPFFLSRPSASVAM